MIKEISEHSFLSMLSLILTSLSIKSFLQFLPSFVKTSNSSSGIGL